MHAPFPTTQWSRVALAGGADGREAEAALAELCAAYWYPLFAFARRKGLGPDAAADVVQGTFAVLLERGGLSRASPERGRFRSFLVAACRNHMADRRDRDRAARRGGGRPPLSIDLARAEGRYRAEPAHDLTAERLFERRWAIGVLEIALGRLEAEAEAAGKGALFERLLPGLTGERGGPPHAGVAAELGMSEGAVRMAALRLRRRYGEVLREEVARTVADPADVEDELRALFAALVP